MIKSLKKVWLEKELTENDYNNLSDLMLIANFILILFIIF